MFYNFYGLYYLRTKYWKSLDIAVSDISVVGFLRKNNSDLE